MKTTEKQKSVITRINYTLNSNVLIPPTKEQSNTVIDALKTKLSELVSLRNKSISYYDPLIID